MKKTTKAFFILFLSVSTLSAFAQFEPEFDTIGDNILFRNEMNGAFILHTNGWGLEYRIGKNRSVFNKWMLEFNLLEYKHSKEIKKQNIYYTNTKSYIYGKINAVYMVRAGFGELKQLNRKPQSNGIELRLFYAGGLSVAFTKPVYLDILKWDTSFNRMYKEVEKYNPSEHFPENIYGRASFFRGFDELKPYPGAYAKIALNAEFGTYNQATKVLEVGAAIDLYAKPFPILDSQKSDRLFLTLYISLGIGKRYN